MFLELKVWSKCSVAYKYLIESLLNMYIFSLTKKRTVLNFYVSFIQMESNMMSTKNPGKKTVLNWFACPWAKKIFDPLQPSKNSGSHRFLSAHMAQKTTINQSFSTLEILLVSTCIVYTLIMPTKTISHWVGQWTELYCKILDENLLPWVRTLKSGCTWVLKHENYLNTNK